MAKKHQKTNAMRILDSKKIEYNMYTYEVDHIDGISVAQKLNQDEKMVFKTLVAQGASKNFYVFVIPVAESLDMKKAAKVAGEKNMEMIHVKDINKVTGYIRGGCSPVGMKKLYTTFVHESGESLEKIINILNEDNIYTKQQKHLLTIMINLIFRNKIKNDKITDNLIRKINKEEEKEMLAILDTIAEENERILQQGIRKGKIEGIKETTINNAKKMKKANIDIKLIMEITGLKKEEIERL